MQARDRLVVDAGEDIGKPCLGGDVVELCGDNEGIDVGGALGATIGAGEQSGFPTQGDAGERAFGSIVGQADPSRRGGSG